MKTINDAQLKKYTTIQIGGVAKCLIIPETSEELIKIVKERKPKYFLGGGSNLLIAEREFELVVLLREFDTSIIFMGNGKFRVGASVRLQKLINTVNEYEYGGIEYLYSVPGLVGGAVTMNAGRGKQFNQCISDYIVSVDVVENGNVRTLKKEECGFEYRSSVFKKSEMIVISVEFDFQKLSKGESERLKKQRIELCKNYQDNSHPNFGSVFVENNVNIMKIAKILKIGKKVHFSSKTLNWILNEGGTYQDAIDTIQKVEKIHKFFSKKCIREFVTWD